MPSASPRTRLSKPKQLILALVMLLTLALVLASGVPLLNKERVEALLAQLTEELAAFGKENKTELKLSHEGVEIQGMAYNKRAVVQSPSLRFSRGAWEAGNGIEFSTQSMEVVPHPSGDGSFYIDLPEPIRIQENGGSASILAFEDGTLRYNLSQQRVNNHPTAVHALHLPPKAVFKPERPDEGEEITITYNPNPVMVFRYTEDTGRSESNLTFDNLVLSGEDATVSIGAVATTFVRTPVEAGKYRFDSSMSFADIGYQDKGEQQGPYHVRLSMEGTRTATTTDTPDKLPESDINIREFSFSGDMFSLTATGKLSERAQEILPFGSADVKVEKFSALRESNSFSPEVRAALVDVATRITGTDASKADTFSFTLSREQGKNIMAGKATMDEVVATFLSRIMLGARPHPPATSSSPHEPEQNQEPMPKQEEKPTT